MHTVRTVTNFGLCADVGIGVHADPRRHGQMTESMNRPSLIFILSRILETSTVDTDSGRWLGGIVDLTAAKQLRAQHSKDCGDSCEFQEERSPTRPHHHVTLDISSLSKKALPRMYFLRQLKKFNLPKTMMVHSYTTVVHCCHCQGQGQTATYHSLRRDDWLQSTISLWPVSLQDPETDSPLTLLCQFQLILETLWIVFFLFVFFMCKGGIICGHNSVHSKRSCRAAITSSVHALVNFFFLMVWPSSLCSITSTFLWLAAMKWSDIQYTV